MEIINKIKQYAPTLILLVLGVCSIIVYNKFGSNSNFFISIVIPTVLLFAFNLVQVSESENFCAIGFGLRKLKTIKGSYWYIYDIKEKEVRIYRNYGILYNKADYTKLYRLEKTSDITDVLDTFVMQLNNKYKKEITDKMLVEELKTWK